MNLGKSLFRPLQLGKGMDRSPNVRENRMRQLFRSFIIITALLTGAATSAAASESCELPSGERGIAAIYVDQTDILLCVPSYYEQLMGGRIDPKRQDVCKGLDENIAAPTDKVPFTVNGSTFCLDRHTAEHAEELIPFKTNP